jgi:hypothetical protein
MTASCFGLSDGAQQSTEHCDSRHDREQNLSLHFKLLKTQKTIRSSLSLPISSLPWTVNRVENRRRCRTCMFTGERRKNRMLAQELTSSPTFGCNTWPVMYDELPQGQQPLTGRNRDWLRLPTSPETVKTRLPEKWPDT